MTDPENKLSPDERNPGLRWFHEYCDKLDHHSVIKDAQPGVRYACPCCGFLTLSSRAQFDICAVCFWEDDGQDEHDAADVRGGSNGLLSLVEARRNFARYNACDERSIKHVRTPLPDEIPKS